MGTDDQKRRFPAQPLPAAGPNSIGPGPRVRPSFPAPLPQARPIPLAVKLGSVVSSGAAVGRQVPMQMAAGVGLDSAAFRQAMVRKLSQQGITHVDVLRVLGEVERHRFVDSALVNQAYEDTSLPIGLGQTISKPNVVARMLELLLGSQNLPLGRVLEIGTGCGYQAALLSRLCTEVYSMERLKGLHEKARLLLSPFRIANLHLLLGDGMLGFPSGAPYAGIIAAAGGEAIPQAWLDQLAVGGRLVAPAHWQGQGQRLVVVQRTPIGYEQTVLEPVQFVPLKSGLA